MDVSENGLYPRMAILVRKIMITHLVIQFPDRPMFNQLNSNLLPIQHSYSIYSRWVYLKCTSKFQSCSSSILFKWQFAGYPPFSDKFHCVWYIMYIYIYYIYMGQELLSSYGWGNKHPPVAASYRVPLGTRLLTLLTISQFQVLTDEGSTLIYQLYSYKSFYLSVISIESLYR